MQKAKMVYNSLAFSNPSTVGVKCGDLTIGEEYLVVEFHSGGQIDVIDDAGDMSVLFKGEYELVDVEDDV